MFLRYLGGGIGHLEQFPPADNNKEDATTNDNSEVEVEMDDFIMDTSINNDDGGEGGREVGEDEDEEDEAEMDNDPGESSDEETGNVY
jgi:hypothetical protein